MLAYCIVFSPYLCPENLVAKIGQFVSLSGFGGAVGFWEGMGEGGLGKEGRCVLLNYYNIYLQYLQYLHIYKFTRW